MDLIENLPSFLMYVVPGFLFLATYRYILYKDNNVHEQAAYSLLKSIVCSFVIKITFDFVCFRVCRVSRINDTAYILFLIVTGTVFGYLIAELIRSDWFGKFLHKIDVHRTINDSVWDDIFKPGMWLHIWLNNSNKSYLGQIKFIENYQREPIVVLEYYQFLDDHAQVTVDYSNDPHRTIMLNTATFERIEIIDASGCEKK